MGRGMRRKRLINPFSSDDDDSSGSDIKKCKQSKSKSKIPVAPLPPSFPANPSSSNVVSKNTPLTAVFNKKQGKTAIASLASTTAGIKQNKLLDKIINLRQQAADKAQQRKEAMSLKNIHKFPVKKKVVSNTLCSELPEINAFKTGRSCRSESQSSIVSSLNSQSIEESSCSSHEMSNDIQSPLSQSPLPQFPSSQFLSDKNSVIQTQCLYRPSTSDSIHQTPSREFSEFVTTKDRNEVDIEPELSLAQSQTVLTSKLSTGTIYI